MEALIQGFVSSGLYDRFKDVLPGIVIYRLNDILAMQYHRKSEQDFHETVENFRTFLESTFPHQRQIRYLTWGGYNLNRVLSHMDLLHDPVCRFNFSSLICLPEASEATYEIHHRNRYRQMMIEKEQKYSFWKIMAEQKPEVIILDLLEERFDIMEAGNRYITISDAFEGASTGEICATRISRSSDACRLLWEQSCREVFGRIQQELPGIRVIIIENYLCETVGDLQERKEFPNLEEIRGTNQILRGYYHFLEQLLPEAAVVRTEKDDLYFTDRNYEYGAIPSHVNEIENARIAERVRRAI